MEKGKHNLEKLIPYENGLEPIRQVRYKYGNRLTFMEINFIIRSKFPNWEFIKFEYKHYTFVYM